MTKLENGLLTSLLPSHLAKEPETAAFAYAIRQQVRKLMILAQQCVLWPALERLSDDKLDALAAELRTPNYLEHYSLEVKRALVKGTLPYYMTAGTPEAMLEAIEHIFGEGTGSISEWFTYDGKAGCFRAKAFNPKIPEGTAETALADFYAACHRVKRLTAHLDYVEIVTELPEKNIGMYMGGRHFAVSQTQFPELEIVYPFDAVIGLAESAGRLSETYLPELEPEYSFCDKIPMAGQAANITQTAIPPSVNKEGS